VRIDRRRVRKTVALNHAPDGRCPRGELGVGEVNPRHGFLDRQPTLSSRRSWRPGILKTMRAPRRGSSSAEPSALDTTIASQHDSATPQKGGGGAEASEVVAPRKARKRRRWQASPLATHQASTRLAAQRVREASRFEVPRERRGNKGFQEKRESSAAPAMPSWRRSRSRRRRRRGRNPLQMGCTVDSPRRIHWRGAKDVLTVPLSDGIPASVGLQSEQRRRSHTTASTWLAEPGGAAAPMRQQRQAPFHKRSRTRTSRPPG
jgi:hypothetical protein